MCLFKCMIDPPASGNIHRSGRNAASNKLRRGLNSILTATVLSPQCCRLKLLSAEKPGAWKTAAHHRFKDVFSAREKKRKKRDGLLASSLSWLIKCQVSWRAISPKRALCFALCTEEGQAILGEIIKRQNAMLWIKMKQIKGEITPALCTESEEMPHKYCSQTAGKASKAGLS